MEVDFDSIMMWLLKKNLWLCTYYRWVLNATFSTKSTLNAALCICMANLIALPFLLIPSWLLILRAGGNVWPCYKLMDHKLKLNVQWNSFIHSHNKNTHTDTHRSPWDSVQSLRPRCSSFIMPSHRLVWGHLLWITNSFMAQMFGDIYVIFYPSCPLLWSFQND